MFWTTCTTFVLTILRRYERLALVVPNTPEYQRIHSFKHFLLACFLTIVVLCAVQIFSPVIGPAIEVFQGLVIVLHIAIDIIMNYVMVHSALLQYDTQQRHGIEIVGGGGANSSDLTLNGSTVLSMEISTSTFLQTPTAVNNNNYVQNRREEIRSMKIGLKRKLWGLYSLLGVSDLILSIIFLMSKLYFPDYQQQISNVVVSFLPLHIYIGYKLLEVLKRGLKIIQARLRAVNGAPTHASQVSSGGGGSYIHEEYNNSTMGSVPQNNNLTIGGGGVEDYLEEGDECESVLAPLPVLVKPLPASKKKMKSGSTVNASSDSNAGIQISIDDDGSHGIRKNSFMAGIGSFSRRRSKINNNSIIANNAIIPENSDFLQPQKGNNRKASVKSSPNE